MRTRSQKIEQPAAAENPPNLPDLPIQENGEQNEEAAANEAPCSSRSVSTSENARASSAVANAGLIENVDDVTNRPCSSRSSPGVICISDSEDSDVLNPVCVDLTSAKTPNKSSSRAKAATVTVLNNTVIELDDSDDELSPARPPARSLNQNAPEKTKSTFGSALLAKSCSAGFGDLLSPKLDCQNCLSEPV